MPESKKIFLLCVGAQKSGTTWLYSYLSSHENVDMGFAKEYHVFDSLLLPIGENRFNTLLNEASDQLKTLRRGSLSRIRNKKSSPAIVFKMLDFFSDIDNYFNYFSSILHADDDIFLTGDITPAYASLPKSAFETIKKGFDDRGIETKVLFLMRDPVERCISASQMSMRTSGNDLTQERFDRRVLGRIGKDKVEARTRYDLTIQTLESVFDNDQIHYEFYERLFNEDSVSRLCDFLGIPTKPAKFDMRVNAAKVSITASEAVKSKIYEYYSPVYDFIFERYSKEFISTIWKNYGC